MAVGIYSPSYRRADKAISHHLMPVTYVVSKSEAPAYRKAGLKVWAVPDEVQGNVSRVRNYILDKKRGPILIVQRDEGGARQHGH